MGSEFAVKNLQFQEKMIKFKPKIKSLSFSPKFVWQIGVLAFLLFLVVLLSLNMYLFLNIRRETDSAAEDYSGFKAKTVNEKLLKEIISDLSERKTIFDNNIGRIPEVSDPYSESSDKASL